MKGVDMGLRRWKAAARAKAQKAFSKYHAPEPLVVLRRADTEWQGVEERLSAMGDGQLVVAASAIRWHYGDGVVFQVYAVSSSPSHTAIGLSARRMAELLQSDASALQERRMLVSDFVVGTDIIPGVITVVVTNEPSVQRLLLQAYGTDDPTMVNQSISVVAEQGVPHYLRLERAKDPVLTRPKYRVFGDQG